MIPDKAALSKGSERAEAGHEGTRWRRAERDRSVSVARYLRVAGRTGAGSLRTQFGSGEEGNINTEQDKTEEPRTNMGVAVMLLLPWRAETASAVSSSSRTQTPVPALVGGKLSSRNIGRGMKPTERAESMHASN